MASKKEIIAPVEKELSLFEPYFRKSTKTSIPLLDTIMNYILRSKGKQMRPILVFLSAKLNGEFNERTYHAALTIELLHTATLVHDDVVDESYLKYGSKRLNSFSTGAMISFFDAMQLLQFQLFIFCFLTAKWKRSSAKLIPT